MPLPAGTRVGHYEILALIGSGGMGEVYSARDTKLGRNVALKVLPAAYAEDPDRMARFRREARLLASLNHPNIATLHGFEESSTAPAIVMELVPGPTLAERVANGPILLDEAIPILRQIADALEYAHERNVIHRDLKPANIKVTPEGVVKVLDFGLAKALEDRPSGAAEPDASTRSLGATRPGVIMGTPAYLPPEQIDGSPADRRADVWAFGVVLFEMLTGKRPFVGVRGPQILAAVMKDTPSLQDVPAAARALAARCLEKDPRRRLQAIGEARILLEDRLTATTIGEPAPVTAQHGRHRWYWIVVIVAIALAALALARFRASSQEPVRVTFEVPPPARWALPPNSIPTLSPDGKYLAFVATTSGGAPMIWVRSLESLELRLLSGTEGVSYGTFWSPDSRTIGFFVPGAMKTIDVSAGLPITLSIGNFLFGGLSRDGVINFGSGDWSPDGVIIFGSTRGIFRVPQAGGTPTQITPFDPVIDAQHIAPQFLPDGRRFLYYRDARNPEDKGTYLATLDGKENRRVLAAESYARYVPSEGWAASGNLLFVREAALMAQPVNGETLALTGEAFTVAERVASSRPLAYFSVSMSGLIAYRAGGGEEGRQLAWFDREGRLVGHLGSPAIYGDLDLSPDGKRVAVTRDDPITRNPDIWLVDAASGVPSRLTFDSAREWDPVWSPANRDLIFSSDRGARGVYNLFRKSAGGGTNESWLVRSAVAQRPKDWSSDGKFILVVQYPNNVYQRADLLALPADSGAAVKPIAYPATPFTESQGQFAPNPAGPPRWIAYESNESGRSEIWVQSFPPGAGRFQISTGGGVAPKWRKDGREIFYISLDEKMMAVNVKTEPVFEAGMPRALFQTHIPGGGPGNAFVYRYDVTADGKKFLVNTEGEAGGITVVFKGPAGLKR